MFSKSVDALIGVRDWVVNAVTRRAPEGQAEAEPYVLQWRPTKADDWSDRNQTRHPTLQAAKQSLVYMTDTPYWIKCRILDATGNVIDESRANDFYSAADRYIQLYISTDIQCANVFI